jgi:hypothetical protein
MTFSSMACGTVGLKPSRVEVRAASQPTECAVEFLRNPPARHAGFRKV